MTTVTRRNFLKGGTALVGGMSGILAAGRAPAYAQATTVSHGPSSRVVFNAASI